MPAFKRICAVLGCLAVAVPVALTVTAPAQPATTMSTRALLPPVITLTAATEISKNSARLNATIITLGKVKYHFEYGTTGFTKKTGDQDANLGTLLVNKKVDGLQPSTAYMWRLVAGTTVSATGHFTTASSNGTPGTTGVTINTDNPVAQTGTEVVATPAASVDIKIPGSSEFVSLGDTAGIPNGSTIRAGKDPVALTSVDASGKQQTGYFWGGTFKFNQFANGVVQLTLASDFSGCGKSKQLATRGVTASAAKAKKGKKKGSLWGRDSGGKFRTKGRSSVATVRGTRWYTEDRCDGTLTKVAQGKVSVNPKKGKTTLVKAGKSFFAKR